MAGSERSDRDRGTLEEVGRSMGGMAGRAAEVAADIGGSMLAGAADALGGWWSEGARDAARSWDESKDRRSRQHFEGSLDASAGGASVSAEAGAEATGGAKSKAGGAASSYEEARPYYQLGHTARQNPDYAARDFSDVEPELRRVAESRQQARDEQEREREWPDVRGYVQFGYEQGEGGSR